MNYLSHTFLSCLFKSILFSFLFGTFQIGEAQSSWKEIGPLSSPITAMGYDGSTYLYADSRYGIYRSSDNGNSWQLWSQHVGGELLNGEFEATNGFATIDGTVFTLSFYRDPESELFGEPISLIASAAAPGLGYICDINGDNCLEDYEAVDFVHQGNRFLIATSIGKIYHKAVSDDYWETSNVAAVKLFADHGQIVASDQTGMISVSIDGGFTWQAYSGGNLPGHASGFARKASRLFASVPGHGVFVSQNGGSWIDANTGLGSLKCVGISNHSNIIYVGTEDDWVWKTTNNGQSWTRAGNGGSNGQTVSGIFSVNNSLFAAGSAGMSRKAPGSDAWSHTMKGLASSTIQWLAADNDAVVAAKRIGGFDEGSAYYEGWVYRSSNPWHAWSAEEIGERWGIEGLQQQDDLAFIYTRGELDFTGVMPELHSYYMEGIGPDYVMNWCYDDEEVCQVDETIKTVAGIGNYLFYVAGGYGAPNRLGISPTQGDNDNTEFSFSYSYALNPYGINRLRVDGGTLIACTSNGIYTSSDLATTWSPAGLQGYHVSDLTEGNDFWLAQTNTGLQRAMKSTPANWLHLGVSNPGTHIIWAKHVLYTNTETEVLYSMDKGDTWQGLALDADMPALNHFALAAEGNDFLFVGTQGRGIWRHPLLNIPQSRRANTESIYSDIHLYPNPSTGYITVEAEGRGKIEIMTSDGRLIAQYRYEGSSQAFDLSYLSSGYYFLKISTEEGGKTIPMSKQ